MWLLMALKLFRFNCVFLVGICSLSSIEWSSLLCVRVPCLKPWSWTERSIISFTGQCIFWMRLIFIFFIFYFTARHEMNSPHLFCKCMFKKTIWLINKMSWLDLPVKWQTSPIIVCLNSAPFLQSTALSHLHLPPSNMQPINRKLKRFFFFL